MHHTRSLLNNTIRIFQKKKGKKNHHSFQRVLVIQIHEFPRVLIGMNCYHYFVKVSSLWVAHIARKSKFLCAICHFLDPLVCFIKGNMSQAQNDKFINKILLPIADINFDFLTTLICYLYNVPKIQNGRSFWV